MLAQGIDTVVLGCTHYPFVIPLIEQIAGPAVRVIDPAPAVARQVARLLAWDDRCREELPLSPTLRFLTTGAPEALAAALPRLLGETASVIHLDWDGDVLNPAL